MKSLVFAIALLAVVPLAEAQRMPEAETSALIAKVAASRAGRVLEADFVETKTLPMWKAPVVESGTIAFEPPDRFLRRTKNLIVSDGKTLWMYYPEFAQAEKYPLDARGPGQLFAALGQALRFENLGGIFHVSATRLDDGFRLDLVPRAGAMRRMLRTLTIELDRSLKLRSSAMTGNGGDKIETRYSNEKFLAPGSVDFSFRPPASASVVSPLGG
jgi:outer membrane lipoprotein-sorting protein